MKKSYWKDGKYIDTTTGKIHTPRSVCQICGKQETTPHHFISQQRCRIDFESKIKYPKTLTPEFVKEHQKIFWLCRDCHYMIENVVDSEFYARYGIKRSDFIHE